ncbi:MAG: hypothetical protein QM530_03300, partial [Phycisphaerales bacterium]|nr:hypothetical protein [Phycisphaerales bacterium]
MKKIYLFLLLLLAGYKPATAQYDSCTTIDYIKAPHLTTFRNSVGLVRTVQTWNDGMALSADGNTLAAGNMGDDGSGRGVNPTVTDSAREAGTVFVYRRTDSLSPWVFQAYIKASNTGAGDWFGRSLSLSSDGTTLAVGALYEDGSGKGINPASNDSATNAGAVYIYTRSGSTWSFTDYIKASNTGADDEFGRSVSLSSDGSTLAVGASGEAGSGKGINPASNDSATDAGAVYIYTRSGSTWSLKDYIKASNTGGGDGFGYSLSLSSDATSLAVGAIDEDGSGKGVNPADNDSTGDAGAVYIYTRSGSTWSFTDYIKASNTGADDEFGHSVSLSSDGSTLAVGVPFEDGSGRGINPADNDSAITAGAVYIYTRSGSTWSFTDYIKASNSGFNNHFGNSLSLNSDGTSLAVGSARESITAGGEGVVYLFKRSSGLLTQNAYIISPKNNLPVRWRGHNYFGSGISLSANGANLAISSLGDTDSEGFGVNPPIRGNDFPLDGHHAVWVYNQYGATISRKSDTGVLSKAKICTDPLYINLKDSSDKSGRRNIARILKNGNSFSVDSAFVDDRNTGTYLATGAGQSTKLMRRMLSIHTTPASGLTVNGGPIVRFYYDTSEKNTQIPTATYSTQSWFKHAGSKASTLADLVYNNLNNSSSLTPVASGFDSGVAYVDFKVTSFSTFGALGSTGAVALPLHLLQFEAKANTDCGVDIRWTTASEKDINRFVVQGSSNASEWEDKAVVQPSKSASGQHQYQYQDLLAQSGTYYYRLMYEENDGTKMYSPVSALRLTCATNSPKLYPTMTQDKVN